MASALLMLSLAGASCGGDGQPKVAKQDLGKPAPARAEPVVCPLTGQERGPAFEIARPALAIKIDNAAPARPQAGLENADIVYEEMAEGGITRFLAVYHCSDAPKVGPVRSARLVDADILREYGKVLLGYSGGNSLVLEKIASTASVVDLRHGKYGKAYRRIDGRPGPHDLFTSTGELRALTKVEGRPKTGLVFGTRSKEHPGSKGSNGATPSPSAGATVSFAYAGSIPVRYTFDRASGSYLRFHGEKPHNSEASGQLRAVNVLVLKVKTRPGQIRDSVGNYSPEIIVIGKGEGVLLSGGVAGSVVWERESLNENMRLEEASGETVPLVPGNTWIHLLPSDRSYTLG